MLITRKRLSVILAIIVVCIIGLKFIWPNISSNYGNKTESKFLDYAYVDKSEYKALDYINVSKSGYKVLDYAENEFGKIWIYDYQNNRCMSFVPPGSNVIQGCMDLTHNNRVIFNTYRLLTLPFYFNPEPRKALQLGIGSGMLTKYISVINPRVEQDLVEINPLVIEYSKKYFKVQESDKVKIYNVDAMDFVKKTPDKAYDTVWVDVFDDKYIPPQFLTNEFVDELKRITKDSAIITFNTYSLSEENQKKYFGKEIDEDELFSKGFNHSFKLNSPDSLNKIIISLKGNMPSKETLILQSEFLRFQLQEIDINQQNLLAYLFKHMDDVYSSVSSVKEIDK